VHFFGEKDECFGSTYDLVLASSSLWYVEDWKSLVQKLAAATQQYLYLTRMVFVEQSPSFIARQRPWDFGYRTEYLCWIFNRREFLEFVATQGVELVREFLMSEGPRIHRAPEFGDMRGFLFRKVRSANPPA
jgi:putative methyltransferase (TIGR04325 family)